MAEYVERELGRGDFFDLFVNKAQTRERLKLWDIAHKSRADARHTMDYWLQAQIDGGTPHLWQWVYFDHALERSTANSLEACCYFNWTGACKPTSGKVHDPRRHHCCICGSAAHGAVGSLTSIEEGQCPELAKYQKTLEGLAKITGASLSELVSFFGFGPTQPLTIRVKVKTNPAPASPKKPSIVSASPKKPATDAQGSDGAATAGGTAAAQPSSPAREGIAPPSPTRAASEDAAPPPIEYSLQHMCALVKNDCLNPSDHHQDELFTHSDAALEHRGDPEAVSNPGDNRGRGRVVCWCECDRCRAPGDHLHNVFVGGYFPRQHVTSGVQADPLRVVVKTFAYADQWRFVQELMTYESLGHCAPRPCAPLVMHGLIKRAGMRNADEDDTQAEKQFMIAVLHREQSLATFIRTSGGDLGLCLKVARGLVHAVATCHNHGVYHRDLKPANVLVHDVKNACQVELIDFEVAHVDTAQTNVTQRGTELWEMPKARRAQAARLGADTDAKQYEVRDAWTLAMILYELLRGCTGSAPQAERDGVEEFVAEVDQPKWKYVPLIMRDCLMKQADGSMPPPQHRTLLEAEMAFVDQVIPDGTHPLLRSLIVATLGFDVTQNKLLPYEPRRVNRVAREHVAVLPFSAVLERLNSLVNPPTGVPKTDKPETKLRAIRNALIHSECAPYAGLWGQAYLRKFDRKSGEFRVEEPAVCVSDALVGASLDLLGRPA